MTLSKRVSKVLVSQPVVHTARGVCVSCQVQEEGPDQWMEAVSLSTECIFSGLCLCIAGFYFQFNFFRLSRIPGDGAFCPSVSVERNTNLKRPIS